LIASVVTQNRPLKEPNPDIDTDERLFSLRRHEQCLERTATERRKRIKMLSSYNPTDRPESGANGRF
jgi:hypothetical protein